ncbi:MAG: hypothetical protein AAF754_09750 [Pseudomonadota bacterium]
MFKILSIAGVITFCAGAVAAAQSGYLCEIKNKGDGGGFLTSPVVVLFDDAKATATVIDPLILAVAKKPVEARLRKSSSTKWRMNWTVNDVKLRSGSSNVSFSATFNPLKRTLQSRAKLINFANHESAVGGCSALTKQEVQNNRWIKK